MIKIILSFILFLCTERSLSVESNRKIDDCIKFYGVTDKKTEYFSNQPSYDQLKQTFDSLKEIKQMHLYCEKVSQENNKKDLQKKIYKISYESFELFQIFLLHFGHKKDFEMIIDDCSNFDCFFYVTCAFKDGKCNIESQYVKFIHPNLLKISDDHFNNLQQVYFNVQNAIKFDFEKAHDQYTDEKIKELMPKISIITLQSSE